ncbi:MAG TPA: Ig-like domain-containing protein, partial [Bryobacteraceae bacterium]|nr:Ig-like domain-containing protein [Bryobacteraceae bacterium]
LTITWTMNSGTGNVTLSAAAVSLGGSPTTASIAATAGTPQSATVGTAFATLLQATVLDTNNNPVSGAAVTFTAPSSGASGTFGGSTTVTTNSSGVATAPTLTANSVTGSYTVTASVAGVATPASFSLTNTAVAASGALSGAGNSNTTAFDLTTEGTSDWVHWGDSSLNRKANVTAQLTTLSVVGAGPAIAYNPDLRPLSWTDGTPTGSSTNNTDGLYINATGNGFSFTAPADTSTRTLIVHVGGWNSGGTLNAHLSDSSAANFTEVTPTTQGQYDRNYTLTYRAAAAGQTLMVTWVMSSGTGNVTLSGAAIQ